MVLRIIPAYYHSRSDRKKARGTSVQLSMVMLLRLESAEFTSIYKRRDGKLPSSLFREKHKNNSQTVMSFFDLGVTLGRDAC